jgi:glc operon protein GlcG
MTRSIGSVAGVLAVLLAAASGRAEVIDKKGIDLNAANQAIAAVKAQAEAKKVGSAVAVVDEGGNLVAFNRVDGTFAAGANVSIGKARTAALFQKPTKTFEDLINGGRTAMAALADFTPLQGGVPIMVDGKVVGAVGVSGAASAAQDDEFATAAATMVAQGSQAQPAAASKPVTYLDSARVAAAFAKGEPLHEVPGYKVHASRREKPGLGEVHLWETDVVYVLEGTATFVTGGSLVEPKEIAPGEIRGTSIAGGQSQQLKKGDVVIVPNGVPHWFKETTNPFLYFVVKPIAPHGGQ